MRILIMSNSPLGSSAYSHITRYISLILKELGHQIAIFAYWGLDWSHSIIWKDIPILTRWRHIWGMDIVKEHYERFKADFLLPIFDIWVTPEIGEKCRTVAYSPTDHDPPSMFLLKSMEKCWKVIPYTNWAKKSLEKAGLKNLMEPIPHGIDLNLFKPLDKKQCRNNWIKKEDEDAFVIGIVAGNYDKEGRKRWDKHFEAIKYFKEQNPDCKLKIFVHTDIGNVVNGFDLSAMLKFFELDKITYSPDPYYFINPLPYDKMPEIYNLFDVSMLISSREGFGMPYIESPACGVPIIGTDFASGSELVHPELKVKVQAKIMTPILSWTAVPDAWDAAQKLEMLYKSPDKYERIRKEGLEWVKQFDWQEIKKLWIKSLDKIEEDLRGEKR